MGRGTLGGEMRGGLGLGFIGVSYCFQSGCVLGWGGVLGRGWE
jgi:hypothetical protein